MWTNKVVSRQFAASRELQVVQSAVKLTFHGHESVRRSCPASCLACFHSVKPFRSRRQGLVCSQPRMTPEFPSPGTKRAMMMQQQATAELLTQSFSLRTADWLHGNALANGSSAANWPQETTFRSIMTSAVCCWGREAS